MNIAKLNTASLDDKTFIIKRGTSGGTTINNQDKVVDITENGTTEVVADNGYTGLGKVTINTEVSGVGGSGEGGGSNVEYLDLSGNPAEIAEQIFLMFSILAKYSTQYGTVIATPFLTTNLNIERQFKAVMIDFTIQIAEMGHIGSIKEAVFAQGLTQADIDANPRLTKEQFYSLE